ncbi:MAG: deoxyribonuclease IV [Acidobacteriota bacterium]
MSLRFGAHMSIAGGIDRSVGRAEAAGCEALQIFTKSARQWAAKPLTEDQVHAFRRQRAEAGIAPVVAHASYLINLASGDDRLWERSTDSCAMELGRCRELGLDGLVLHPGAHGGDGEKAGLGRVARALERIFRHAPEGPKLLLETTAGQGTALGGRLQHLRWLLDRFEDNRAGVCLDTCHLHAAGYALGTPEACAATLSRIDGIVGFNRVEAIHCNDSLGEAGSHLDRHAHIGTGTIGERGFAALLADPRLDGLPALLETPKDEKGEWDRANLARLRALHRGETKLPAPPPAARSRQGRGGATVGQVR